MQLFYDQASNSLSCMRGDVSQRARFKRCDLSFDTGRLNMRGIAYGFSAQTRKSVCYTPLAGDIKSQALGPVSNTTFGTFLHNDVDTSISARSLFFDVDCVCSNCVHTVCGASNQFRSHKTLCHLSRASTLRTVRALDDFAFLLFAGMSSFLS